MGVNTCDSATNKRFLLPTRMFYVNVSDKNSCLCNVDQSSRFICAPPRTYLRQYNNLIHRRQSIISLPESKEKTTIKIIINGLFFYRKIPIFFENDPLLYNSPTTRLNDRPNF